MKAKIGVCQEPVKIVVVKAQINVTNAAGSDHSTKVDLKIILRAL